MRFRIVLTGGTAGMLSGWFRASRTTADCDVLVASGDADWPFIEEAARGIADRFGLPRTWLNRDASNYLCYLPLGWEARCTPVRAFQGLDVLAIGRSDLIAAKLVSCPQRPQDLEDLRDLDPTDEEWKRALENIDRVEREDLDGRSYERHREIARGLRGVE
ncbi:MAG: hypothetical protein GIKADHBN_00432 [Phycisphaerales bacterium]|nr:hypothetical protein [Phycisphaerales bacterium]